MSQPSSVTSQPPSSSLTLSQAWTQAQRDIQHTQSPPQPSTPDTLITLHSTAAHSLLTLRHLVHTAGVLSANDRLSDLPTSSLRYVLVPSLLAGVLLSWPGMDGRRGRLEQCMNLWQQLLTTVDVMDGLTEAEERRWRHVKAVISPEGSDDDGSSGAVGGRMDAAQQRQDKIARFKQQREWQQQIEGYEARQQQARQRGKRGASAAATVDGDGDEDDADEEAARQYWLLRVRVAVNSAMDELLTGQQEMQFLKERQAREANPQLREEREREEEDRRRASEGHKPVTYTVSSADQLRNQPIPPHMQAYLQPLPPATANSNGTAATVNGSGVVTTLNGLMGRGRREDVFRVVNGATMSVEEWAEQEMAAGRLPTPQQPWRAVTREERRYVGTGDRDDRGGGSGGGEEDDEGVGEVGGESDERRLDAKRGEERDWDNWKDDHERGAGNRQQ